MTFRLRNGDERKAMHELLRVQEYLEQSGVGEAERDMAMMLEGALQALLNAYPPRRFVL